MRRSLRALLVAFGIVVVALWVAVEIGRAQGAPPVRGFVLSGSDVGFRITGQKDGKPIGQLVVRQNGEWVEPSAAPVPRLLSTK